MPLERMSNADATQAMQELKALQAEMNLRTEAVRQVNARFAKARATRVAIPTNELPQVYEELKRHGAAFKQAAEQAVTVYGRLRSAGYGTPALDAWAEKVEQATVSTGG